MVAASRSRKANKARMLVVDDEPDNLDLLYRTFRRDFNVLRAESGQQALDVLAEHGEVAVIISDQRMPEMKGTEFLSKTVPEFPDTVRIILTGFTDVEDLVDAINAGQVYRYITKPWDPDQLKHVVEQAAQTYELLKQRGEAIDLSQSQQLLVTRMAEVAQTASDIKEALPAIAEIIQTTIRCHGSIVHLVTGESLGALSATTGEVNAAILKEDPLVSSAIADRKIQLCRNTTSNLNLEVNASYNASDVKAYCLAPVLFRDAVTAIVALQWQEPQEFSKTTQDLVLLAAKQTGLTLACL
ncbi:MAG: response regulator [Cyanobacteria bacterium P01_F01_bin.86]